MRQSAYCPWARYTRLNFYSGSSGGPLPHKALWADGICLEIRREWLYDHVEDGHAHNTSSLTPTDPYAKTFTEGYTIQDARKRARPRDVSVSFAAADQESEDNENVDINEKGSADGEGDGSEHRGGADSGVSEEKNGDGSDENAEEGHQDIGWGEWNGT